MDPLRLIQPTLNILNVDGFKKQSDGTNNATALKKFHFRTLLILSSRNRDEWIKGMPIKLSTRGIKRLEVTMRDVMDGLEDAASYMNYLSVPETVEILSIEPPGRTTQPHQEVIQFNRSSHSTDSHESSNIVDYLIERELRKSA